MKKAFLYQVIIAIMIISCSSNTKIGNFAKQVNLTHKLHKSSVLISNPLPMFLHDSLIIIVSPRSNESNCGVIISTKAFRSIGNFGAQGKGPKEVIYLYPMPYRDVNENYNQFQGYDMVSRSLVNFAIYKQGEQAQAEITSKINTASITEDNTKKDNIMICKMSNSTYMGLCFGHQNAFFSYMDKDLQVKSMFGTAPVKEEASNYLDQLQGLLRSSYGIAIYAPHRLPYISCYTLKNSVPTKKWEDEFATNAYQVKNGVISFSKTEATGYTIDLAITQKHIYLLWYNGGLFDYFDHIVEKNSPYGGNVILVYDHKGNRIVEYNLDIPLNSFDVTDDDKIIYGLTQPNEKEPEYQLVSFDL